MFELYLRCPATDEPVYAGIQSDTTLAPGQFDDMSVCPACGARHEWSGAAVWSAIPVVALPGETPAVEAMPAGPAADIPFHDATWPKVA